MHYLANTATKPDLLNALLRKAPAVDAVNLVRAERSSSEHVTCTHECV